jgi:AcrR family transcriptional regulator
MWQRRSDQERRIIAAAAHQFGAYGFAGARIAQIAAEAGLSKERLYHYVGGKQALYAEVLQEAMAHIAEAEPFVADRLGSYVASMLEFHDRDDVLIHLLLAEGREPPNRHLVGADRRREHYRRRVAAIHAAQEEGAVRDDVDARVILYAVLALVVTARALPQITDLILDADDGRDPLGKAAFHEGLEHLVDALLTSKNA